MFSESDCREETSKYLLVFHKYKHASDILRVLQVLADRTHTSFGREIRVHVL